MEKIHLIKGSMPRRVTIETIQEGEESFGDRLKQLRQKAGISLRDLAEKVGVSHRMLHYYESKKGNPPVNLLPILAKVLGVSADEILGMKKTTKTAKKKTTKN